MSKRRHPGEIVRRRPGSCFCGSEEPSLVRLTDESDGDLHEVDASCSLCADSDCQEWANVQVVGTDRWLYHLSECEMLDVEDKP